MRAILDLPTDENVRDYLLDAEGRLRRRPSSVHRAIKGTLKNHPEDFCLLNGGVVLVARDVEIDEQKKILKLLRPSIINGAQTQGVVKDYFDECERTGIDKPNAHIKFEAIITRDDNLIGEVSIARNFQNDVMSISIAGRLGQLNELQDALRKNLPDAKLKRSETELSPDYLDTEHLLQVLTVLIPRELWFKEGDGDSPNKTYAYSRKSQCLKEFREIYEAVHSRTVVNWLERATPNQRQDLYRFYLDVAAQAFELHEKWRTHQGFIGTRLHSIERENGRIVEVPDGIIFPILASLSAFAIKTKSGWQIRQPCGFDETEVIAAAAEAYKEIANSNPSNMGRTKACYSHLYRITSIYKRLEQS